MSYQSIQAVDVVERKSAGRSAVPPLSVVVNPPSPSPATTDARPGMYRFDQFDQEFIDTRVDEYRGQSERYLAGELNDEQFRPLRLMNGLYIERHAPMLRVAIPYGQLSAAQLRMLAQVARNYDRGFGHFTTRQNIQFNWPELPRVPDLLADLATVQLHAIQTSGSCIRNTTTDHLAGIAVDEVADPRPYCEFIRQWSTLHPEFSYLPRKFKIAVTGAVRDRAASQVHDIGLHLVNNPEQGIGFEVLVGGGLGRTPHIGQVIREFLPASRLLSYLEAILRVYNQYGRRDNKYKARIKILVNALGIERYRELVEAEWESIKRDRIDLDQREISTMQAQFCAPGLRENIDRTILVTDIARDTAFASWVKYNTVDHKQPGYRGVYISLKAAHQAPGDLTAAGMDAVAALSERYSFGLVRTTHTQNLLLPYVMESDLYHLWRELRPLGLATANIGTLTDIICCPGLDYCSLANATSLPIAHDVGVRFDDLDYLYDLGDIQIKISGCMNACGHHHVGHIGILGVDKKGEEWYQITVGGSADVDAALGKRIGPAIAKDKVVDAIERLIEAYTSHRMSRDESFLAVFQRVGIAPFKESVYG